MLKSRLKEIGARFECYRSVRAVTDDSFRSNASLVSQMECLHSQAFTKESLAIFRQRMDSSNALYYRTDDLGNLLGFFLVSHSEIFVNDVSVNTMFCGPMIMNDRVKGTGLTLASLLLVALQDAQRREIVMNRGDQKTVVWGISAVPTALKGAYAYLHDVSPRYDGTYAPDLCNLVCILRRNILGSNGPGHDRHPFLLKRFFKGRLAYNRQELLRIKASTRSKKLSVFSLLGFDETEGDGILFVGKIPPDLMSSAGDLLDDVYVTNNDAN